MRRTNPPSPSRALAAPRPIGRSLVAASLVALASVLIPMSAGAQVDPEPTTTMEPTTIAPTTVAPTTVAPTTVAPTTVAPTTAAPTTQRPVVTTAAPTTTAAVVAQPSTTASSTSSSSSSSTSAPASTTTAGLLVEQPESVDTEPVADSEGLNSATKLRLIVAGLIAIAVVVAILTIVYWRKTRPYEWEEWEDEADDDQAAEAGSASAVAPAVVAAAARPPAADPTAEVAADDASPATDRSGSPAGAATAGAAAGPVVPSLIDPEIRAKLASASGPEASSVGAAGPDLDTQAVPVASVADASPAPAAGSGADEPAPARWGTERAAQSSGPADASGDPDAPFRPPPG